jgi:hypothetical protein
MSLLGVRCLVTALVESADGWRASGFGVAVTKRRRVAALQGEARCQGSLGQKEIVSDPLDEEMKTSAGRDPYFILGFKALSAADGIDLMYASIAE